MSSGVQDDGAPIAGGRHDWNLVDNESQIDTSEELAEATNAPGELSADDLSRELNNPNTPLAKLSLENVTTFYDGDLPGADSEVGNVFLFQPVFPFPLTDDGTTNLFIRPGFSFFSSQPVFNAGTGEFESETAFGDMGFDVALGRSYDSGMVLVGGVQGTIPIGADEVSTDQFRLGPELIVAHIDNKRVFAAFPAHQWDVSGGGPAFSTTTLELFALKFLEDGWVAGTQPQVVYDWEGDQATIPLNLTLRKVVKFGSVPAQVSLQFDYFFENNDRFGPEYAVSISLTPIVSNFIYDMFQ